MKHIVTVFFSLLFSMNISAINLDCYTPGDSTDYVKIMSLDKKLIVRIGYMSEEFDILENTNFDISLIGKENSSFTLRSKSSLDFGGAIIDGGLLVLSKDISSGQLAFDGYVYKLICE